MQNIDTDSAWFREIIKEYEYLLPFFPEIFPEKEYRILEMRYGLVYGIEHSRKEIGKMFGVTTQRVTQLEAKAHDRMYRYITFKDI